MPRLAALLAGLLSGTTALASGLSLPAIPDLLGKPHLPAWAERWLYNPRERTGAAMQALQAGKARDAMAPADTALRLAPADPQVRYNDGTAHLLAGDRRGSVPLLEKAAKEAAPALAPRAWYNLGNARLGAGDAAGAVEAYKQALRRAPGDANTKYNLELALQEREKERLRAKSPKEGDKGDRQGEQGSSQKNGPQDPSNQQNQGASDPGQSPQKGPEPPQNPGDEPQKTGPDGRPLPRFRDQPEMSAQEAAALLQSVENLERQQRRQQAAQRSQQRAVKGKDW